MLLYLLATYLIGIYPSAVFLWRTRNVEWGWHNIETKGGALFHGVIWFATIPVTMLIILIVMSFGLAEWVEKVANRLPM